MIIKGPIEDPKARVDRCNLKRITVVQKEQSLSLSLSLSLS